MQEANALKIPHYVKAKSPDKLMELMLAVNLEDSMEYRWDVRHDGKLWFGWYVKPVDNQLSELTKG